MRQVKFLSAEGLHITHNDSDAIGCALVADFYLCHFYKKDNETGEIVRRIKVDWKTFFTNVGSENTDKMLIQKLFCPLLGIENPDDFSFDKELKPSSVSRDFVPYQYILISDISLSDNMIIKLEEYRELMKETFSLDVTLIGIDHHKTNTNGDKCDWFTVYKDPNKGACLNMLEYADEYNRDSVNNEYYLYDGENPFDQDESGIIDEQFRVLIDMISRYDTFAFKRIPKRYDVIEKYGYKITEDCITNMITFLGCLKTYNKLKVHYEYCDVEEGNGFVMLPELFISVNDEIIPSMIDKQYHFVETGAKQMSLLNRTYNDIEDTISSYIGVNGDLEGFKSFVKVINDTIEDYCCFAFTASVSDKVSEISYRLLEKYRGLDIVFIIYPNTLSLGFRSREGSNVDVSSLAKELGGGGHPNASGCPLTNMKALYLMNIFHLSDNIPILSSK